VLREVLLAGRQRRRGNDLRKVPRGVPLRLATGHDRRGAHRAAPHSARCAPCRTASPSPPASSIRTRSRARSSAPRRSPAERRRQAGPARSLHEGRGPGEERRRRAEGCELPRRAARPRARRRRRRAAPPRRPRRRRSKNSAASPAASSSSASSPRARSSKHSSAIGAP
jgi:hypothetical protein